MLVIPVGANETLPLRRTGFCRVLVEEFDDKRHVCFVPVEFLSYHRGYSDMLDAVSHIRAQAPGLSMKKVEML